MRGFFALLLLIGSAAHADLYRWVDPQTGSVKFSSVAPPASQRGVEVVPYRGAAPPAKPAPSGAAALELRWHELLAELSASQASPADSPLLQQQLRELVDAGAELDRADPAGAARRRAELESRLQRLLKVEK